MRWPDDRDKAFRSNAGAEALGVTAGHLSEAVLLGKGGDDGLWMRLVGSGVDDFHRCGGLVVAPKGVAYTERLARIRR